MATDSVRVVARVTAKPGAEAALAAVLRGLVAPTRAEAGCIAYELMQDRKDPATFVFVEQWASDAAIEAHMGTTHVQQAFAKAGPLLGAPPDIRTFAVLA